MSNLNLILKKFNETLHLPIGSVFFNYWLYRNCCYYLSDIKSPLFYLKQITYSLKTLFSISKNGRKNSNIYTINRSKYLYFVN